MRDRLGRRTLTLTTPAPARLARRPIMRGLAVLGDRRRRGPRGAVVARIPAWTSPRPRVPTAPYMPHP